MKKMINCSSPNKNRGMGFLFVFFPADDSSSAAVNGGGGATGAAIVKKNKALSALFRRSKFVYLISSAQSTISICVVLVFITLLLFTLSTFEPASSPPRNSRKFGAFQVFDNGLLRNRSFAHALQGMGKLYRRGTRAMNDLVVAHSSETLNLNEFKLFLRLYFRSGISSKSDLLLLFQSKPLPEFVTAIQQETESFLKLVFSSGNSTGFDSAQFMVSRKKERESGEPIWGQRAKNNSSDDEEVETESTRVSYGSVVSFDSDELDSVSQLDGFIHNVPMSLRRWACYPMLLGRVRRNFKHFILLDIKEYILLGDPMSRLRAKSSGESVFLSTLAHPGRKDRAQLTRPVSPGIIMGGSRGVRRFSNAVLTEIVRAAMQHKKKSPITESGLLSQLVGNEFVLRNINLVVLPESVPELSSLTELNSKTGSMVIRRDNNDAIISSVLKYLCSLNSDVYSDC